MTNDVKHVSQETYDEICRLLDIARRCDESAKMPGLSLMRKLAFQHQAKELRAKAQSLR